MFPAAYFDGFTMKRFLSIITSVATKPIITGIIIPFLTASLTAFLSHFQNIESHWIIIIFISSFALISIAVHSIVYTVIGIEEWGERTKINGNLTLIDIKQELSLDDEKQNVTDVSYSAIIHNKSRYQIQYEIQNIVISSNNSTNTDGNYLSKGGVINQNSQTIFYFHSIKLHNKSKEITGDLSFDIKYGKPNDMKYISKIKLNAYLSVDKNGNFYGRWVHKDSN